MVFKYEFARCLVALKGGGGLQLGEVGEVAQGMFRTAFLVTNPTTDLLHFSHQFNWPAIMGDGF